MEINIKKFLELRSLPHLYQIDDNIIMEILYGFDNNDIKKIKKSYKKNIIPNKNNKIKIIKDKIVNKIKLILNKLSQNNIHNLVLEFIENIKINTQDDFNDFINIIYLKILSEINFVKIYLEFFQNIICIYTKLFNFNYNYFYDLIETKFMNDYFNSNNEDYTDNKNIIFVEDDVANDFRINNLFLIKEMVNNLYFNNDILTIIDTKILNQTMYLSDIYYWFKDTNISKENIKLIKNILDTYHNIEIRDKILLENLISPYDCSEQKKNKIIFFKKVSFDDNVNDLLKNFSINNNYKLIKVFIEINCNEINNKTKFCEISFSNYFLNNFTFILELIEKLIIDEILSKNNICQALININENNNDLINENIDMKSNLISLLKKLDILKNLEFLTF